MITYIPQIYPDELIYSWLCRHYIHAGYFSHKMALSELYCKKSDNPSKEFIGNLNPKAKEKICEMYDFDKLILKHTMYPQYARFIPLEQRVIVLQKLKNESKDIHYIFSNLPRNEGEKYLKYCPLCVIEDKKKYGETYWHRIHQIRNMNICTKHKCKLKESNIMIKSEQTYTFCPAENHVNDLRVTFVNNHEIIEFAEYIENIFNAKINFDDDTPLSSILYNGMSKTKYMKNSGRSRFTKMLYNDMNTFYQDIGLNNIASLYQIQRVLLGNQFDFSVVCQVAFFLKMKIEELVNPTLTIEQIEKEKNSHYMRNTTPIDWEQFDKDTAPMLEQIASDIYNGAASDIGRPERVSERAIYRELNLLGQRLNNMPKCKAIFEKYTESYAESWARKIIWAYEKLNKEKCGKIYWSDIRTLSGVKKHNFQSTIPYLKKYSNEEIVKNIIELGG